MAIDVVGPALVLLLLLLLFMTKTWVFCAEIAAITICLLWSRPKKQRKLLQIYPGSCCCSVACHTWPQTSCVMERCHVSLMPALPLPPLWHLWHSSTCPVPIRVHPINQLVNLNSLTTQLGVECCLPTSLWRALFLAKADKWTLNWVRRGGNSQFSKPPPLSLLSTV